MLAALHRRRRNGWWHFQLFSDPNSAVDGDLTVLNALVILTPSPATLAHGTGQHKILHYNFDALVDTARRRATLAIPLHNITQRWPPCPLYLPASGSRSSPPLQHYTHRRHCSMGYGARERLPPAQMVSLCSSHSESAYPHAIARPWQGRAVLSYCINQGQPGAPWLPHFAPMYLGETTSSR